jgi:hypothetical protein
MGNMIMVIQLNVSRGLNAGSALLKESGRIGRLLLYNAVYNSAAILNGNLRPRSNTTFSKRARRSADSQFIIGTELLERSTDQIPTERLSGHAGMQDGASQWERMTL